MPCATNALPWNQKIAGYSGASSIALEFTLAPMPTGLERTTEA